MRKHRAVFGRIHIPVGIIILFAALSAGAQDFNHHAVELAIAPPLKLVSAQTKDHHWRTSLFLTSNASAPAKIHVDEGGGACPSPDVTLAPNGAAIIRDVALTHFCGAHDVQLFPLPAGADSFVVLSFDDGKTQSSFELQPIGAITSSQRFGPIVSDGEEGTWVNTFPDGKAVPLSVQPYDGSGNPIGVPELYETTYLDEATGKLFVPEAHQHRLKTRVPIGFIVISGWPGFPLTAPLYGFVNSGTPRGGNFRAFPFGN